jgi:hypothetical protein
MARDKSFDPYSHKMVRRDGPNTSQRLSTPHPKGGFDGLGKHDEIQPPQHAENKRDVSPRYSGDASGRYWNDTGERWTRGFGDPYPHFDHSKHRPSMQDNRGNTHPKNPSDGPKQDGERRDAGKDRFQARRRPKG